MTFLSELKIDRHDRRTVSEQIVSYVAGLVSAGRLTAGTRLPSIRDLAERTGVSCNAAVHAYEILADRGLIASRPCAGYFVSPQPMQSRLSRLGCGEGPSFLSSRIRLPERACERYGAFLDGGVEGGLGDDLAVVHDLRVALFHLGQQLERGDSPPLSTPESHPWSAIGADRDAPLGRRHPAVSSAFIETLARDLLLLGIPVSGPESLLLVPSLSEALLVIFWAMGLPRGGLVFAEDPGDPRVHAVASAMGLRLQMVRRTEAGLALDEGFESAAHGASSDSTLRPGPRVLVVTPSFQNPTGTTLSLAQRHALLEWAGRHEVVVIEMDPFPGLWLGDVCQSPLAALEQSDRVIHISALGSVFSSRLTSHAICAAQPVIKALLAWRQLVVERADSSLELALLGDLVSRGGRNKQLLRLQRVLAARQALVDDLVHQVFPEGCQWSVPEGGLYAWLDASAYKPCEPTSGKAIDLSLSNGTHHSSPDGFLVHGSVFGADPRFERCCRLNLGRFDAVTSRATLEGWWRGVSSAYRH